MKRSLADAGATISELMVDLLGENSSIMAESAEENDETSKERAELKEVGHWLAKLKKYRNP
jgi:hypothetical protein